ncbi:MAG: choice-of-anchor J domain-containing protein, partial [Bacteroides sp.]|nr:choice-of-anchor J domain-containing protein [Bacteroides sp.]
EAPLAAPARAEAQAAATARAGFHAVTAADAGMKLSSFTVGYSATLTDVMDIDYASGYAGTAIGGDFYYCAFTTNSAGGITAVDWRCIDVAARAVRWTKPQTTANAVCMDITHDPTTGALYGISAMTDALVTIDPATGTVTAAVETLPFYTLAADLGGNLYGILMQSDGTGALYTVNRLTGGAVKIGDTGVTMLSSGGAAYFQTAAFSRVDGRLYWLTPSATGTDLYRVDIATGRAAALCTLPALEALCMFDLPAEQAAGSPAPVSGASATVDGTGIKIAFDAPAKSADGSEPASLRSIDIYRGGAVEPLHSISPATPGKAYTYLDPAPADGINTYRIVAVGDRGESLPAYVTAFYGDDYPQAPGAVEATAGDDGYPVVSWTAPVKGLNGLDIDPATLTYNVYRDTAGTPEQIATGVSATSWRDATLDLTRQAMTYYYVSAVSAAGEGARSAAAGIHTGPAYRLPFEETFADGNPSTAPWTMQSLTLGGAWEVGIVTTAPGTGPYTGAGMLIFRGFTGVAAGAEARVVTPVLTFEDADAPALRFHFYHADFGDDMHFDDHMLVEVSADGGPFEPLAGADLYQYTADTRWTEYTFSLARYARRPNVRIGFRGISAAGMDLALDNIRLLDDPAGISAAAPDPADAPAEYYDLQGRRVASPTRGIYILRQGPATRKVVF